MSFFFSLFFYGLCLGMLYAFVAVGYSLIYGVLRFINFAHGEIFAVGAYGAFVAWEHSKLGAPWLFFVGIVAASATACIMERFVFRPISRGETLLLLSTSIGISVIIRNVLSIVFGDQFSTIHPQGETCFIDTRFGQLACGQVAVIVASTILGATLWVIVRKSQFGRTIRAVASNRDAAEALGLSLPVVYQRTFFLGGAYAGAAGVLFIFISELTPRMGEFLGLKAFTAAVIGGIGSISGSFIAGVALGLLEALATGYLGSQFQNSYVLIVLLVILFIRSGRRRN